MVSINTSANAAVLASIRQINNEMATTQLRIGTGKKVNSSSDNASVWAIAQNIRAQQSQQDGLGTGISLAKGRADTAIAAVDTVVKLLGEVKSITSAANSSTDFDALQAKLVSFNAQIKSTVDSASLKGENWLTGASAAGATVSLGFLANGTTANTISVATKDLYDTGEVLTLYTANAPSTAIDATTAKAIGTLADAAIKKLGSFQASLSTFSTSLGIQQDFMKSLSAIRETALSNLVDADLTEENAKITALQTQQQLAYQALSIGNSGASSILRLFQ